MTSHAPVKAVGLALLWRLSASGEERGFLSVSMHVVDIDVKILVR